MLRIKVTIGDNDDSNFSKEVRADINSMDYLVYKDAMNTCSPDEYDEAWNRICDAIGNANPDLPYDWFVDSEIEAI